MPKKKQENYARMREFDELDRRLEYSAGVDAGRIEGREEGREEGINAEKLEIARKMLKENYDISTIKTLTELSENEILHLKESA